MNIRDEKLNLNVRPTLNLFIKKQFGMAISSLFLDLAEKGHVNYINTYTEAGLVGTVVSGRLWKGQLAKSGYKLTVIDEITGLDNKSLKILNEITEHGRATRILQTFTSGDFEEVIEGGKYKVSSGMLELNIHTSFAFVTASDSVFKNPYVKTLMSRCFCLNLTLSKDEALQLKVTGRKIDVENIKSEIADEITLPADVNMKLLGYMEKLSFVEDSLGGYYMRAHDDMVRISAVYAYLDDRNAINEEDVRKAIELYPLHQIGFKQISMSENEIKIYMLCNGKTTKELSQLSGLSERQVRYYINLLLNAGLVARVGDRYFRKDFS